MPPFQLLLKTTAPGRGIDTYDNASWLGDLWGVRELEAVACFFDIEWLEDVRNRLARSASLTLHLNRPPSGSQQMVDLLKFIKRAKERGPTHVYLHTGQRGLFHSKLYVMRYAEETITHVGSSNATGPAFTGNEEVLLQVTGVNTPAGVEGYLESLKISGRLATEVPGKISLPHFLREARLVFRPTRTDPFRLQLRQVQEAFEAPRRAQGLLYSGAGASFSLWNSVGLDDDANESDGSNDFSQLTASLRPRAIETTYGFWVPLPYFDELKPILQSATSRRVMRLEALQNKLKSQEEDVRVRFNNALDEVERRGRREFTPEERNKKQSAFDHLLEVSQERLGNPEWREAHAKRLYDAVMPDLFSDIESRDAFLDSFIYDLELRLDDPGGKKPRIIRAFAKGLNDYCTPALIQRKGAFSGRKWFINALESMLEADGFTTGDLWRIGSPADDE
jgi:hypothetical protein